VDSGWNDVRRRTFLATTTTSLLALLADRLPGRAEADGEQLDRLADAVAGLRFLDGRDGSATILMPATWVAGRLFTALANTAPGGQDHRAVANLAADAAELAGWAAFEVGEDAAALGWCDRAIAAAGKAGNPSLAAYATEDRVQVMWKGFGDIQGALRELDMVNLDRVAPGVRARLSAKRGRLLALKGEEAGAHRAIEAAMKAVSDAADDDGSPWSGWVTSLGNIQFAQGQVLADLGYGDGATHVLTASMRRLPSRNRRAGGSIHLGLAKAAILEGEPEQAAKHTVKAHEIFVATMSRQVAHSYELKRQLEGRWGDVSPVRQIEEQFRISEGGSAYRLCRTSAQTTKLHRASCGYARRGQAGVWTAAKGLDPAAAAALARTYDFEVCTRCMPA
jgi:hypothetical protein